MAIKKVGKQHDFRPLKGHPTFSGRSSPPSGMDSMNLPRYPSTTGFGDFPDFPVCFPTFFVQTQSNTPSC